MTKAEVTNRLKSALATNEKWAIRGMLYVFQHQTQDEQSSDHTNHHNNIGFNANDAFILSQFAKSYEKWGRMTPKQMVIVFRKMPKYAGQIIRHTGREKIETALNRLPSPTPIQQEEEYCQGCGNTLVPKGDFCDDCKAESNTWHNTHMV